MDICWRIEGYLSWLSWLDMPICSLLSMAFAAVWRGISLPFWEVATPLHVSLGFAEVPTNTPQHPHSRGNFQIPYHIDIYKQVYLCILGPRVLEVRMQHATYTYLYWYNMNTNIYILIYQYIFISWNKYTYIYISIILIFFLFFWNYFMYIKIIVVIFLL